MITPIDYGFRVALAVVTALLLFLPAAVARPDGDFAERAASFPAARDSLPEPAVLGEGFRRPWEGNAYTEEEWRGMFDTDPRAQAASMKMQLEMLSDEDYREMLEAAAALAEGLREGVGGLGEALTAGGAVTEAVRKKPVTREQAIAELDATITGIHDWAHNDYYLQRPVPGAVADDTGIEKTDDDSVSVTLTVYTDEYLTSHRELVDLSGPTLAGVVDTLRETERKITEANERDAASIEEDYDRLAEFGRIDSDEARANLKVLARIASSSSRVEGKLLSGAGKGFLVIVERRDCERQSATVTGRIRRGNAVIDLTRLSDGPFVETAWRGSEEILRALAERLAPFAE